jgi:hypothetical protein
MDIGITVLYRTSDGRTETVLPLCRVNSHLVPEDGMVHCAKPGLCMLFNCGISQLMRCSWGFLIYICYNSVLWHVQYCHWMNFFVFQICILLLMHRDGVHEGCPRGHLEDKFGGLGLDAALLRLGVLVSVAGIYANVIWAIAKIYLVPSTCA